MRELKNFILLFCSLLLASSLSLIISLLLVNKLSPILFLTSIPSMSSALAQAKTFDLLDFILTILLGATIFFINLAILHYLAKKNRGDYSLASWFFLIGATTLFIQTHFVSFSRAPLLVLILLTESIFLFLSSFKKSFYSNLALKIGALSQAERLLALAHGLLLGFFFLLLTNYLWTIPLLSLSILILIPLLFLALSASKRDFLSYFPAPILPVSLLFPNDFIKLLCLGLVTFALYLILKSLRMRLFENQFYKALLLPFLLIFLLVYSPTFFIGNFDSVEEGFFLGWVQRLIEGQSLYKDVLVYHPPLLSWGMFLFQKIIGFSVYSERLFLHLAQILGSFIFLLLLKRVLSKPWLILACLLLFLSFNSTLVRNNSEIRLGVGLLSFILLFAYLKSKRVYLLILSGISLAIALLTSIEVGAAAIITSFVSLNLLTDSPLVRRLKTNGLLFLGLCIVFLPISGFLLLTQSFNPMLAQITFYLGAFSKGYFNLALPRSFSLSFFHWHIFNQYLSSRAFYFESAKLIISGSAIYLFWKWFSGKFNLELKDSFILTLSVFGLILSRSSLGRSDLYHLLFVLSISLIIIFYAFEKLSSSSKVATPVLVFALFFYFAQAQFNSVYLENQLFKFQTYGRVVGQYTSYNFPRASGLLSDKEINPQELNDLFLKITSGTSKDDTIFVYPWMPELYFYTDRRNASSIDTPYAFFTPDFQNRLINELRENQPKLVIYNPEMKFGGLAPDSLPLVKRFIEENYQETSRSGQNIILIKKI